MLRFIMKAIGITLFLYPEFIATSGQNTQFLKVVNSFSVRFNVMKTNFHLLALEATYTNWALQ